MKKSKGEEVLNTLMKDGADKLQKGLSDIAPDFANLITEVVFGEVYGREGLDLRTKQIITISALTTLGHAQPQLAWHIKAGLNIGITQKEIINLLIHLTPYAGFPAINNAMATARKVFEEWESDKNGRNK